MKNIKIVYIDDFPDLQLSEYLDMKNVCFDMNEEKINFNIEYSDIKFEANMNYENLITNPDVKNANIVIIDSRLFENSDIQNGKFTGEEFKIILKKYFPFIEVIVITQNPIDNDYLTLKKYEVNESQNYNEYYKEHLLPKIEQLIKNILEFRKISLVIEKNNNFEKLMIERILQSLKGHEKYAELTKNDIDTLVTSFKQLKEKLYG